MSKCKAVMDCAKVTKITIKTKPIQSVDVDNVDKPVEVKKTEQQTAKES